MKDRQEVLRDLSSTREELVDQAIREIREDEDFSIVPDLVDVLLHARDPYLITRLTTLLADVKEAEVKNILVSKLVEAGEEEGRANLLRVCWESAIDFSEYLEIFADLLIDGDYITAIEASTVIENLNGDIPAGTRTRVVERLKNAPARGDRSFLVEDAVHYLSLWQEE
jgi:hypothetical protein